VPSARRSGCCAPAPAGWRRPPFVPPGAGSTRACAPASSMRPGASK
jgi:hypothetical protein